MNQSAQAVLTIYIFNQGNISQGKFFYLEGKPCFIANMTLAKWWINFKGYSISKRILDSLPRGTQIIYKRLDLNTYYTANRNRFEKHGILIKAGKFPHDQWVLPLKQWDTHQGKIEEPTNLPLMDLEDWSGRAEGSGRNHLLSTPRLSHTVSDERWNSLRQKVDKLKGADRWSVAVS